MVYGKSMATFSGRKLESSSQNNFSELRSATVLGKRNKNNDAKWKIIVNISFKPGKFTTFKNLDLTAFGGRLIYHFTPSATRKLKLTRTICVLPSLQFLKLKTTSKTKLNNSIWKNPPSSDSNNSFQPCQMLSILIFIHYPNFSGNASYRCHAYLV